MVNMLFMAYDGDDAGKLVGRAILANDVAGLHEVSKRIATGHEVVGLWVEQNGGQVISGGGDEGTFQIPADAIDSIEQLRADYQYATNLTMTVGVGASLSEAGKSLMAGKFRGKNQVVHYDPSVDQELIASQEHVQNGTATEEEKKIGEAYLQAPPAGAPAAAEPHCQYCAEVEHDHDDNCVLCQEYEGAAAGHDHTDDCQYCREAEAALLPPPGADHEHTDDCQYCQEADAAAGALDHEHSGDDCAHCAAGIDPKIQAMANGTHEHSEHDCQYCAEADAAATPAATPIDPSIPMDPMAAAQQNTNMEGGVSRPVGYGEEDGSPSDADGTSADGAPENGAPDLHDVLSEGLDEHQDQIAKEKVMNMVGQALAGFKAQKAIFEQAQQSAPQLYQSTILMLKAMIEMGKMLGLQPKLPAASPLEQAQQAAPAQPGQPAAAQGDAAQAPQQ